MGEKLKSWVADDRMFVSLVVVLVAVASFILGRMSAGQGVVLRSAGGEAAPAAVSMTYNGAVGKALVADTVATTPAVKEVVGTGSGSLERLYVASKSGSKYHHRDCAGAKRIKDENRIYFNTQTEARAAGYEPAANCSQLNN